MMKDGSHAEGGLEFFKGFVGTGIPGQGLGLSSEHRCQWGSMETEIFNEASIEISKSQESLKLLH